MASSSSADYDVVIIGAGISGINAAYRVQTEFPQFKYCILEARHTIGGTWDLFKYPGIRSDSDLFTFGFHWYPWNRNNPIASGDDILDYLDEATSLHGIDKNILLEHRVNHLSWSSPDQEWQIDVDSNGQQKSISGRFVVLGTGYYDYHKPLEAQIPGLDTFQGPVIHPQFWPEKLDYTDKKVVVVGSGATAITLIPKLAEKAKMATMLQRSPTYILELPNRPVKSLVDYIMPRGMALSLKRFRWILTSRLFFLFCTAFPNFARWILRRRTTRAIPKHMSFDPHFNPAYNPWEQRLCVCPDGDFFKSLHTGRADVVTGTIKAVTATGIELTTGQFLDADIIVTATGLKLQLIGGASVDIDGKPLNPADKFIWRGAMLQDVPNAAFVIGYTNASWTLGADATAAMVVRLLRLMRDRGCTSVVPRVPEGKQLTEMPVLNLTSTYVTRAQSVLPKAATEGPWRRREHYTADMAHAKSGSLEGLEWVHEGSAAATRNANGNGKAIENGNGKVNGNGKAKKANGNGKANGSIKMNGNGKTNGHVKA
ncbi:flavin-binding monooxygenase [Moelleriella libera RCEF 2490]|uniref:Flavin-binding monooxygenase n=1 Tax=Moelleriella libera RCEF 2490 TaxID=1081109 RepID=A0A166V222_9HYPO|nr:flavin-binding monooxygenase [Moelleriella libera RCEF 2490]